MIESVVVARVLVVFDCIDRDDDNRREVLDVCLCLSTAVQTCVCLCVVSLSQCANGLVVTTLTLNVILHTLIRC